MKETYQYRKIVQAWVSLWGWMCPGYLRNPHPSRDLTIDHRRPRVKGGGEGANLRVLCRSCNSSKRQRNARPPVPMPSFPHPLR